MAVKLWQGDAFPVAQVGTVLISGMDGTPANTTYSLTVYDEGGVSAAISVAGRTNVNTTASDLNTAWNASGNAVAQRVTSTVVSATLTLTADTAGVPFTVVASTAGGSGSIGSYAAVTANSGPNDWNTVENWWEYGKPVATNDIVIPAGKPSILYGLDQNGYEIYSFKVLPGYTNTIGGTDNAYLQLDMNAGKAFEYESEGQGWIDLGDSDVDPHIRNTGTASTGQYGLSLKATALSHLHIYKGSVGFGIDGNDTTSEVADITVNYIESRDSDAHLTIGPNVKDLGGDPICQLTVNGGTVVDQGANIALVKMEFGTLILQNDSDITALNLNDGTVYHDGGGTTTTLTMNGGTYDTTRAAVAKTVTAARINSGEFKIDHDFTTQTTWSDADDTVAILVTKI